MRGSAELGSVGSKRWASEAGRGGCHVDSRGQGGLPGGVGSELIPGGRRVSISAPIKFKYGNSDEDNGFL